MGRVQTCVLKKSLHFKQHVGNSKIFDRQEGMFKISPGWEPFSLFQINQLPFELENLAKGERVAAFLDPHFALFIHTHVTFNKIRSVDKSN